MPYYVHSKEYHARMKRGEQLADYVMDDGLPETGVFNELPPDLAALRRRQAEREAVYYASPEYAARKAARK